MDRVGGTYKPSTTSLLGWLKCEVVCLTTSMPYIYIHTILRYAHMYSCGVVAGVNTDNFVESFKKIIT